MSELKFKVGDVVELRNGSHYTVRSVWEYDGCPVCTLHGFYTGFFIDCKYRYAVDNSTDIVRILGNVSDFERLRQLEAKVQELADDLGQTRQSYRASVDASLDNLFQAAEGMSYCIKSIQEDAVKALKGGPDA